MLPESVEVNLVVSGVELDDEPTLAVIAYHLDDLLWSESAGIVTATVFAESDPVHAAVTVASRIHAALPEAHASHVQPDLVTMSAIAARVGVSRQAVRQWVTGSASIPFPAPFAVLEPEGKPVKVWRWADVTPWLNQVKGLTFEPLPTPGQIASIDAELATASSPGTTWSASPFGPSVVYSTSASQPSIRVFAQGA